MPRTARVAPGGYVFHVLNRAEKGVGLKYQIAALGQARALSRKIALRRHFSVRFFGRFAIGIDRPALRLARSRQPGWLDRGIRQWRTDHAGGNLRLMPAIN